jgi:hypothetical protein
LFGVYSTLSLYGFLNVAVLPRPISGFYRLLLPPFLLPILLIQ